MYVYKPVDVLNAFVRTEELSSSKICAHNLGFNYKAQEFQITNVFVYKMHFFCSPFAM